MRMLNRLQLLFIVAAILLVSASRSLAWIDTGHKIIAQIAWDEMTPQTRAAVIQALKAHPRYEKDLVNGDSPATAPAATSNPADGDELEPLPDAADRHVFGVAATWPDMVRGQTHPMHVAYNHPSWHYI